MAKEFVIKHGLIVHGEITGSDIRIDDWNSVSASLSELSSNVGETVTTASISGNVITFTKSDGTTFETVVQEDTGSFFTSASVDLNTITFHYGNNESGSLSVETGTTQIRVKNTSGSPITKGTPVYITGNVGNTDMLQIAAADASDLTKMPAVGLLLADLSNNGEGYVIQGGYLKGLVTDTIDGTSTTSNDTVYVKAGGGLTMTKPTGDTNYIQNIAKVARVHGSAGSLVVSSILRTNDVPNLPTGKIWVGNGTTVTSSFVHLDETNQRLGIGTDTPLKPLHIDNDSVPIRLESDTHNAVVVNYKTDEVGTGNGIQVGAKGQSDFFVQQDVVTGGSSQWNVNVYVSQSGKVYLPNLDGALQDQILYYNNETGELTPGAPPDTGSFFTSASVDLNTITFQYGASGSSGTLTIDTGSNFISNVEIDHSTTGSSLVFTGEGGAFNGAVDLSRAYQQGGGMTLNYSGSVLFNAASEWSGGNPNRKVSSTVTSMRDSGWNEWRFSDISRNFSSQYHNNAHNESVFDLITTVVNHTGQLIVRVYDDKDSAYEGFYMNSGSATIKNNAGGAGDLSLYLKHIGGRGWGATSGTPGNNTVNNTNVAFSFTGTQLYESGSQSQSAFNEASVTSNVVTLTRDDGTREVLAIDTGSAVTTDISALNTFTGSIQTEVDSLNSVTGSFIVDGTATGNTITFTLEDRSTFNLTIDTGSQVSPDTPLNTFQFNSSGEFGGSTLYFDDTTKQVGVNIDVPRATFHVRGANNGTGSLLIETDSVGGSESGFAKLDFRVADNDGGAFKKFAIIAENEGGGTNEANYGLGQLHFALNNDITMANAKIADSKLTLDHEGNIYMPDIDTGTTLNTIYYNTTSGELTYGLAPTGSGGGTVDTGSFYVGSSVNLNTITFTKGDGLTDVITVDTGSASGGLSDNFYTADGTLTGNRTLDFNGNGLTFDILNGENFNIAAESNATVGIALDNSEFQITGLASSTTANVLGIDASGNIKTMSTSSFTGGGGGGSGTVNTGVAGYLAYYPSNGTTVDDQTGLYWNESNGRLGLGTTNPLRAFEIQDQGVIPVRLESSTDNAQLIQLFGANSTGAGIRVGTIGINDFTVQQSEATVNVVNTNLYVSESGETYLPRLAADATPSDVVYYDSSTGELSYGSAPSGGSGETYDLNVTQASTSVILNLDSTSGTDDSSVQLDAGTGITLTRNASSRFTIASSGGGSGTPGGSTTQVQFNDGGSFGGDAGFVYNSTNDRLGIGVTGDPTNTLHLAKGDTPILLDGNTAAEDSQYIQFLPDGLSTELGMRIGVGYSSTYKSVFTLENHNGTSWSDIINIRGDAGGGTEAGLMRFPAYATTQKLLLTNAQTNYITATDNSGFIYKVPFSYNKNADSYGIGTTAPNAKLHINGFVGSGSASILTSHNIVSGAHLNVASRGHFGSVNSASSGQLQVTGNVSGVSIYASHDIVAYSDARSKVNIETIPDALEKVNAVRGVTYNKVDDPEGMRYMGVIAQELLEHLPEVVHQGEEGNYSVAYGNVVGVLIEAVKELTAKVEDLESRLGK